MSATSRRTWWSARTIRVSIVEVRFDLLRQAPCSPHRLDEFNAGGGRARQGILRDRRGDQRYPYPMAPELDGTPP